MSRLRALMPIIQSRVIAEPDGTIRWQGRRWLEVEPLVFRSIDSDQYLVFRDGPHAQITELHMSDATYKRIQWWEQRLFHLGILGACVIAFLIYPVFRVIRRSGRSGSLEGRLARVCAVFVAVANLTFIVGLGVSLRDLGAVAPLPVAQVLLLSLPIVSLILTVALCVFAVRAWREG